MAHPALEGAQIPQVVSIIPTEETTTVTNLTGPRRTPLHDRHVALGAKMVDFAGWDMPLNYPTGVVAEHLATRRRAGLFDVSHMGRFSVAGPGALAFLQSALTNDAAALEVGRSHYTLLSNETGGAIDDAYLYRFVENEYLLVVNASNREKDWAHLIALSAGEARTDAAVGAASGGATAGHVKLVDLSERLSMISLQGPLSEDLLNGLLESGPLPEPRRNALSLVTIAGTEMMVGRTGYTGEPLCLELIAPPRQAIVLWDLLVQKGAVPCGLGARDTLRLEAALPLYGHEQGIDPEGREMPILSCPVAAFGVNLSPARNDFLGRDSLLRQREAYQGIAAQDYSLVADLPRLIRAVAVTGRGVARAGSPVAKDGRAVGWVTSGTMVPYWRPLDGDMQEGLTDTHDLRSICLAYLDSDLNIGERVTIDIRGRSVEAVLVPRHLRSDVPPYAQAIIYRDHP
jgi:aminomethyltransferase